MTALLSAPIQQDGRTILWSRYHFTGGLYAPEVDSPTMRPGWPTVLPGWTVVRHVPKVELWVKSTHAGARKAHRVKYQLVATHVSGERVTLTALACHDAIRSPIIVKPMPQRIRDRCWECNRTRP